MSQLRRTSEKARQPGLEEIAERLREVLASDACLQAWLPYAGRRRAGAVNQAAVAQVVAGYLWDAGLASEHNIELPRQLKDRIGRALRGEALSAETLGWLTHALPMDDEDVEEFWRLLGESQPESTVTGSPHRTVGLHEYHYLGPSGLPHHHRTTQHIKALGDGLASYVYRFDTEELEVTVERGGQASPVLPQEGGIFGVEVTFPRPLQRGEVTTLDYSTTFHYRHPPEPVFRRQVRRRVENMEMLVQFHRQKCPRRLRWATWDGLEGPIVSAEEVPLEPKGWASRYVTAITNTTIGFIWDW